MPDKRRVFVIDDESDICTFTKSVLERTGRFEVAFATEPSRGMDLIRNWRPDLVILDIFMPEMDGGDVANYLLENESTKHIPIIFLTALARKSEVEESAGTIAGRSFIAKPVKAEELISRIDSVLETKA